MTAAGYAGMIGTLAFVLGLVLLVAKLAKRFLQGAVQATGVDSFAVVQRIPLGQRQGIAIVQRGDLLIGVSVGDGGVRTLFTMPNAPVAATSEALIAHGIGHTDAHVHIAPAGTLQFPGTAAAQVSAPDAPHDLSFTASFRKVLGDAMRGSAMRAMILVVSALSGTALYAQATAPARPAPTPVTAAPARTGTPAAAPAPAGGLRTLPPAGAQPGPRDLPQRLDPTVQAPRLSKPAPTASKTGGEATISPLLPAPQARDIAALQQRAEGNAPLTTAEAQRIAGRADSMISKLAPQMELKLGGNAQGEGLRLSGTVGVVIMMGLLSMLPVLLLMMTGFTRILIVLHFLKQALGTQSAPPGQLLAAMALLLSGFVMAPTLKEVNSAALEPWMEGKIEQVEMMSRAVVPFKAFMLRQVRDQDLQTFVDLAEIPQPESREAVPLTILMSAFVTSELRTAFQIGFALFLPFIVIDVVVGSVLMSMGMVMLPPAMISLPFKLLLFVLVDGWGLVVTGLVQSFR
ncbi:MAG: flagellar type III secretion system pore protein FliP [Gemmatimonadaceae bacterium]|nr:flagellar type III secretion system pore protein FliP [Gemmatimonadaceae bacterium]